ITEYPFFPSNAAIACAFSYPGLSGSDRAEPNIATAGGILASISNPSTNSAKMRKIRHVSLLVKSSMTYCSSIPFRFMTENLFDFKKPFYYLGQHEYRDLFLSGMRRKIKRQRG